jgi:hypothetical protein
LLRLYYATILSHTQGNRSYVRQLGNFIDIVGPMVGSLKYQGYFFMPGTFLNPKPPFLKQLDRSLKRQLREI